MRKRKTTEEFIKNAIIIFGNLYDYSKTKYVKSSSEVIIICKTHGEFIQRAGSHVSGHGCDKCAANMRGEKKLHNIQTFIKKALEIHGPYKNSYLKTNYKNLNEQVIITCNKENHGDFKQTPNDHLYKKRGCKKCANELKQQTSLGWSYEKWQKAAEKSKEFDSYKVYIIKCLDIKTEECFFKIGKTYRTLQKRFIGIEKLPYDFTILKIYYFKLAKDCSIFEKFLHSKNKENKYLPKLKFGGMHECFSKIK